MRHNRPASVDGRNADIAEDMERANPHLISHIATQPTTTHQVQVTTEMHYDLYEDDLGKGVPVYDEWAIDDDATGADPDAKYEHLGAAAAACAEGRGFRTPAGRPASNELWRFRVRGCQDCWAALFFFALLGAVMLLGAAELHHFSLSPEMADTMYKNLGLKHVEEGDMVSSGMSTSAPESYGLVSGGGGGPNGGNDGEAPAYAISTVTDDKSQKGGNSKKKTAKRKEIEKDITIYSIAASEVSIRRTLWVLGWSAVALAVACMGLTLFRCIPRFLIVLQCWVEFSIFAITGLILCLGGNLFGAILFACLAVMPLLWLYLVQDRIPFAVALLTIASRVVQRHKGLVVVSYGIATTLVLFSMLTLLFLIPPVLRAAAEVPSSMDGPYVLLVLFTLLWVEQVLVNIMHVTASGVIATWYFAGDEHMPDGPVRASFKRATTVSIGSICVGSLFVTIVRFLRYLVQLSRGVNEGDGDGNGFVSCVLDCLMGCIEDLLRYFNTYAFVHVAIYGCSYTEAARRTWALTQQCFCAAVFNDCIVYQAVHVLSFLLATGVAIAGGVLCSSVSLGVTVFFISFFVNSIVFQVVQSAVTTIFVCAAEVPEGMELSFPELYAEFTAVGVEAGRSGSHSYMRSYGTMH